MDLENHCCVISRLTLAKTLYDPLTAVLNLSVLFSVSVLIFVNSPATVFTRSTEVVFKKKIYILSQEDASNSKQYPERK